MDHQIKSPTSLRDAGAPEVAYSRSPIFVPSDAEGLQKAEYFAPAAESPDDALLHKGGIVHVESAIDNRQPRKRRRRWLCYSIWLVVLLAIFAAGIGAGIGIQKGRSSDAISNTSKSQSPTTVTVTGPSGTSSATTSAVTSGSTGIAAYSCNDTVNNIFTTPSGTKYVEDCHTDYWGATWNASYTGSGATVQTMNALTVYSFQACMDQCDTYNAAPPRDAPLCKAVTYNANLTHGLANNGGNCWLKNTKGAGYSGSTTDDYFLMASAYLACVVDGC